jgi:hypothetical protein
MNRLVGVLALLACEPGGYEDGQYCKDYVACAYKTGALPGSLDSTFGPNGSCWVTSKSADSCTVVCKSITIEYKSDGVGADAGCTFGG